MQVQMRNIVSSPAARADKDTAVMATGERAARVEPRTHHSPLAMSALQRFACAAAVAALLWLAVAWALWS
jgi:hypothetical protein